MTNHVLLLGAGFSRNWDGYLATEIIDDLHGRLSNNIYLSEVLRKSGNNFEDALTQIQLEAAQKKSTESIENLSELQGSILDVFGDMNRVFANILGMEFISHKSFSILNFLSKFNAIFMLNQDLLFELHYDIELQDNSRWDGHYFPYLMPPANTRGTIRKDQLDEIWTPDTGLKLEKNVQPIYKLHGSVNWRDKDGDRTLVIGANKQGMINGKEILGLYADKFREYLSTNNTRLMVIGYGFLDDHINDTIYESWERDQKLKMFIVDPLGLDVFNKYPDAMVKVPNKMEDIGSLGVSKRPLSTTFGGDELEHGKLMRFFEA